jgi:glycerol-3-phosphate dehydrogenase
MAADVVDRAIEVGGLARSPSKTATLRLHGWKDPADGQGDPLAVYGSDAARIRALGAENPEWDRPLHPALPYRATEVGWAARHEAARTIEDVLTRRTRALFLDARASIEAAPAVAALLASVLGKGAAWQDSQVARFRDLAAGYLASASS